MGRGRNATGPFYDENGIKLTEFNDQEAEYGNSFLLGDDGAQLVPGHRHLWEEGQRTYMAYDNRTQKTHNERDLKRPGDIFGIRRIHWVNGWPTVWQPLSVTFRVNTYTGRQEIGKPLTVALSNVGEKDSVVAFDLIGIVVD